MRIISIFLLVCSALHGNTQNADSVFIKRMVDEVMVNGTAYDNLHFLCKKIGPRLCGSANAVKAVQATAAMLRLAGADTVYLQPCMVPHWVRGDKEQGYIELKNGVKHTLRLCALGRSPGTGKAGITARVIEVKNFNELDHLGEKGIKGNMVFFNFPMDPTYIRTARAYAESVPGRATGPSKAAKYGAVAAMVRSLASNKDDFPHTGVTFYNDSFPKIPAIAISTNDAEWLSSQLKKKTIINAYIKTMSENLPDVPSFNVVGEIRGRELPEEIITVGGHLDSWDLGEGAHDDGAGCVQSIEVLRVMKKLGIKPRRTIRAVLFMDEEIGGSGPLKYFEQAKIKSEKHIFAFESDWGGMTPRGFNFDMPEEQYNKIIKWKDLFFNYGVYDFTGRGSGSDIGPLKQIGTALAALNTDSQRFFDIHHAATDVFETVSRREIHLGAANMAALIWLVSEYGL